MTAEGVGLGAAWVACAAGSFALAVDFGRNLRVVGAVTASVAGVVCVVFAVVSVVTS